MRSICITLKRKDLLYDIGNVAYITGDLMEAGDAKAQSGVQDVVNEGNVDVVTRMLDKSFNELVHNLTAYTAEETKEDISLDTAFAVVEEYTLLLKVPENFSKPNARASATAAHSYLVNMVLYEWFSVTKKDEAGLYKEKAEEELKKIRRYLNARVRPVRRRMHPW